MRHGKKKGQLGRNQPHRTAMLRNMATSLLEHEKIETTDAKAKLIRSTTEKLITLGKRGDLHARRNAARSVQNADVLRKLFGDIAQRFADRAGGYTRIIKSRIRVGDNAPLSIVELVGPRDAAVSSVDDEAV